MDRDIQAKVAALLLWLALKIAAVVTVVSIGEAYPEAVPLMVLGLVTFLVAS